MDKEYSAIKEEIESKETELQETWFSEGRLSELQSLIKDIYDKLNNINDRLNNLEK